MNGITILLLIVAVGVIAVLCVINSELKIDLEYWKSSALELSKQNKERENE